MPRFARPLCALLLLWVACARADEGVPEPPPNLVLIIGDDHGAPDFGFMGSPVAQTPALDRLAAEGSVFRRGYTTSSLCRPSLRTLLTGLEPLQFDERLRTLRQELRQQGLETTPSREIRGFQTLPRWLGQHGYRSFQAGKHWEGPFDAAGFSEGMTGTRLNEGSNLVRETMQPVYDFIDANRDVPFFLWFAPMLPHAPFDAPPEYRDLYADAGLEGDAAGYYANVSWFDAGVRDLVAYLEAAGLRERTLIVYLADNGWDPRETRDHDPLAQGKNTLYDLGFRTPIVFHWPGRVPAGVSHDALVSSVDLFPTLLDLLGVPPLPDRPGHSLRPLLEGEADSVRDEVVAQMRRSQLRSGRAGHFIRRGDWRYILYDDGEEALYELGSDPGETRDVAREHPELVADLKRRIGAWEAEMRASPPD